MIFKELCEKIHKKNIGYAIFPLEVIFKKSIFEEDFVETGMKAYLTGIEEEEGSIKLYFYFGEHEGYNKKFFRNVYPEKNGKRVTAIESNDYEPHYSVYADNNEKVEEYLEYEVTQRQEILLNT